MHLPVKGLIDNRCHALEAVPERRAIHTLNAYFFLQKIQSECKYLRIECYFRALMEYKRPDGGLKMPWSASRGNAFALGARGAVFVPSSGKDFYVWYSVVLLLLWFYLLVQNTLFVTKVWNSFCNIMSFSILNISQTYWLVIEVSRYRPNIFKAVLCL